MTFDKRLGFRTVNHKLIKESKIKNTNSKLKLLGNSLTKIKALGK